MSAGLDARGDAAAAGIPGLLAALDRARRPWGGVGGGGPLQDARPLFEAGGGKMFGLLVGRRSDGTLHRLRAFSGMYGGRWSWPGWAPPLFEVGHWRELEARYDPEIAALTRALEAAPHEEAAALRAERAQRSRALMRRYHELYELKSPSGETRRLIDLVGPEGLVSGMGDCCAPKLLDRANRLGLRELSFVEFFVGEHRTPGRRVHGRRYPPCDDKCGPLMDWLLGT